MNLLFTAKGCGRCCPLKTQLDGHVEIVDVDTPEGMALAEEHNVMAIPTAIIGETRLGFGASGEEVMAALAMNQS